MPAPKVSVVLCGYNQAAYVDCAVRSVLSQTYSDLELIAVDNGSTDESRDRLKAYAGDARVRLLLHESNDAVTKRLNEAIGCSSGEFVSILYADDYYLPEKLERQLREFGKLPSEYGVVYSPSYREDAMTGRRWIDPTLRRSGAVLKDMFTRVEAEGFINPISPLMKRECLVRYPFHEDVFQEGENIYFRLAVAYKFQFLDEPLTVMREHTANMGKAIKKNAAIALTLYDRLSREPGFPPELVADLRVFRATFLGTCGWLGIRMAEDPVWARECLASAIRLQPARLLRVRTLGALALSLLPVSAIRMFNGILGRVRKNKETVAFKADYR